MSCRVNWREPMKVHWKKLSVVGVAVVALAACNQRSPLSPSALSPELAGPLAAQTGNGAPTGKLVFSWNLIGTPGDYEGGCGEGRRISWSATPTTSTSSSRTTTTAGTSRSAMRPSGTSCRDPQRRLGHVRRLRPHPGEAQRQIEGMRRYGGGPRDWRTPVPPPQIRPDPRRRPLAVPASTRHSVRRGTRGHHLER